MIYLRFLAVVAVLFAHNVLARADSLSELSDSFWQWRAVEQPFSDDDIPRIERPAGFVVDWSAKTIAQRLQQLKVFEQRWNALAPSAQTPVHDQVDYRLLGSALARVRWELSIEQSWKRNPQFYVDQTLGSVFLLLLQPPPFSEARQQEIVARMKQIPTTLQAAQQNLTDLRQPFVQLAINALDQVSERSERMEKGLARSGAQPITRRCNRLHPARSPRSRSIGRGSRPNCPPPAKTLPLAATTTFSSCAMSP